MAILLEVDHIQFVLSRRLYFEKTVLLKFALFVKSYLCIILEVTDILFPKSEYLYFVRL